MEFKFPQPVMSRFERAALVAARAQQIAIGTPSKLDINTIKRLNYDSLAIAEEELRIRVIPMVVYRTDTKGEKIIIDATTFR